MKQSNDDTNTLVLSTTIDMGIAGKDVITITDGTDVLVMLLHFWNSEMGNISLLSRKKAERLTDTGKVADEIHRAAL